MNLDDLAKHECLIKDCTNSSASISPFDRGRSVCIEPDDDGWICEICWQFLITGEGTNSAVYRLAAATEYAEDYADDEFFAQNLNIVEEDEERIQREWEAVEASRDLASSLASDDAEWETLLDHFATNGVSRLSYIDLLISTGMNAVREGRLTFDNFNLDEKVILKRNGVLIYTAGVYERDACRCENFACNTRWRKGVRRIGWDHSPEYLRYLEILEDHERRLDIG